MNFYIAEPVTRLPLFNFLVRYIFTEVLIKRIWVYDFTSNDVERKDTDAEEWGFWFRYRREAIVKSK